MRAVRIHRHGGPEVLKWEEAPDPDPGPGEVLVRVKASSINRLDTFVRKGMSGVAIPFPRVMGSDAAGVVERVGPGIAGFIPGERVVANPGSCCGTCGYCAEGNASQCLSWKLLGENRDGAQAEWAVVPAATLVKLPGHVAFEAAAAVGLVGVTAWSMLMGKASLRPGETVLIHGVGAGVGSMALQIAKLAGARVIATSSDERKLEKARDLGADACVHSREKDVAKEVRAITEKRGADVVVDYIGETTWQTSLKSLRRGGRLVTCGATTGFAPREDLRHIFFRQLTIRGSTMGTPREFADMMRAVFEGKLKPVIDRLIPAERIAEGHRVLEAGKVFGKIVVGIE